ncbi:MAG: Glycosyltransferase involved in cell wall bisynthesis [Glomeribacter sp. 1016415]|nr:Glycosyltransferase involved in cell wall bisynthesis [Glomeribacter sp. 1016415]
MAKIAWLIPPLMEGSGGHRTILQHAFALEARGHECALYIEGTAPSKKSAIKQIEVMFGYCFANAVYGWENIEPADLAMATMWYTAAIVRSLPFPCLKMYFVQDYEPYFYPMGDNYLMAESSYTYGLTPVTIGRWLSHELKKRFNIESYYFEFGADLSVYKPLPNIEKELAVCFIYQPGKPRRCARIGLEALSIVKHKMPEVKIYLYGSQEKGHIGFEHEHLGLLNLHDCNALYNRSAVGLCLSSSNPSRIPFEMMAAGLPLVEMWRENTLYDLPVEAVMLCLSTPEAIAEGILTLLQDEQQRIQMGKAAAAFMSERPLSIETNRFIEVTEIELRGKPSSNDTPERIYTKGPIVSGLRVGTLLPALHQQLRTSLKAYVYSLHPLLRRPILWGARIARRIVQWFLKK